MKMKTAWWGCQILAKTDKEKATLEKLAASLPDGAEESYEVGTIEIINPDKYTEDIWAFTTDEVKTAKVVIEIQR